MEKVSFQQLANFTPKQKLFLELVKNYRYTLLSGVVGTGKALKLEEDILTPYGFKKLKDLKVGDIILNPDGDAQTIIGYYPQGIKKTYRVYFADGAYLDCSEDHLWLVKRAERKRKTKAQWRVLPTKFLMGKRGYYIPINEPLKFNRYKNSPPIHPYLLGVLLGDGTFCNHSVISLTNYDEFIIQKIRKLGYKVSEWSRGHVYSISKLYGPIKELGLDNKRSDEKFIPDCYKWASIEDRIELVRGLMDTAGFVEKSGRLVFYTTSLRLAEDLKFVLRSLGAIVMTSEKKPFYKLPDGTRREGKKCYVLYILSKHNEQFVSLPRKKERIHQTKASFDQLTRKIVKIEEIGEDEMACIRVDNPNGLFIAGKDLIVTHNSRCLRWTLLYLLLKYASKGYTGLQAGLFCNTYPELNDRHLKYIKQEFPKWLGTYKEQKHEFHLSEEYGGGILAFRNLDEPEKYRCFSEDTEVLVRGKGFIPVKDLREGDFCLSLNPKTKTMEWHRVKKMYIYDYDGEMIDYFGRFGVSFCVTPNHKMLIRTRRNKDLRFVLAKDLPQRFYVPVTGKWEGEKMSEKIIFKPDGNKGKTIECSLEDFLRFLGWFLAEGCVSTDGNRYEIKITQCHGKNHEKISEMLNKLGVNWHYNGKDYTFNNKALYLYLEQFGKSYQKFIPQEFKDLPPRYLKILLEGLILGDGTEYSKNKMVFVTTSERLRDDVTEICLKLGYSVTCLAKEETEGRIAGGKLCKWRKSFHLTINKRNTERACEKFYPERILGNKKYKTNNFKKIHYKGKIYGPVVPPYFNILIRHRGRIMFIGQSSEFAFIGVDELTQIPKETFDILVERNRWAGLKDVKFIAASNPIGPYKEWVRRLFIEKQLENSAVLYLYKGDNPYLPENYYDELAKNMDEPTKKALLEGDWYALDDIQDKEGYLPLLTSKQLNDAIIDYQYTFETAVLGVDPGAGGDATTIVIRDNSIAKILFNKQLSDTMQILPLIADFYKQYRLYGIVIDITGIGKGIYDRLNEVGLFSRTLGISFGQKADEPNRFFNKKAELFWRLREWILKGGKLLKDNGWNELLEIKYKHQSDRVIRIQPKEELLKKGIKSPNVADALALTFAVDLSAMLEFDKMKEFMVE